MSNIGIPLNSYINTKDNFIIHQIDAQEKDALQKKNTLQFQSTLSPMYYKSENKVYTTSGHRLTVTNNQITDELGRNYSVDNSYVVESTNDLTGLWSGELRSAAFINNSIYSLWKEGSSYTIVRSDKNNNVLSHTTVNLSSTVIDFDLTFAVGTRSAPHFALVVVYTDSTVITIHNADGTTVIGPITVNEQIGKDITFLEDDSPFHRIVGVDDKDCRKRRLFVFDDQDNVTIKYGIGTIGANGLATGEPLPLDIFDNGFVDTLGSDSTGLHVLENGVLAYYEADDIHTVSEFMQSNEALKTDTGYTATMSFTHRSTWGGVDHGHFTGGAAELPDQKVYIICGYDFINNSPLWLRNNFRTDTTYAAHSYVTTHNTPTIRNLDELTDRSKVWHWNYLQVDLSDGLGNLEWNGPSNATIENGCNPFPYIYFIFNKADSRGIYWDYGPGWSRCYVRTIDFDYEGDLLVKNLMLVEPFPLAILSYGLSSVSGENQARIEYLDPFTPNYNTFTYDYEATYDEWRRPNVEDVEKIHTFNPTIFEKGMIWVNMIGADNMPNHSILSKGATNVDLVPSLNIKEQLYEGNHVSTSMMGTLLTSASAHNDRHPQIVITNTGNINIFDNGLFIVVKPSGNIKLTKVADYIYKTNSLKGNNLFIDSKTAIKGLRGFIPFNDEEIITLKEMDGFRVPIDNENTDGNDTYYSASGYNAQMNDMNKRNVSYLLPAVQYPMVIKSEEIEDFSFQLLENKKEITKPLLYNQFTYKDDAVDHYYTHSLKTTSVTYQTGKKMQSSSDNETDRIFGVRTWDIDKEDIVWWVTNEIQIFPLGITTPITGINYLSSTVDQTDDYTVRLYRTQNVTFPVYNPNTEVYKGSTIFTIYGYNYSFDGQSIYYLGSGDDTTQNNFACYALGMKFLANSGIEAYFYSSFEKRLYLFTGSVTLQIADSLAREGEIVDSVYSSLEQIFYLMTDEGNIIAKSQDDMCLITNVDPTKYHFEVTDTGVVLVSDTDYKRYRLWKTDETEWLPIEYETEFIGKNDSLFKVASIDITFFKGEGNSISGLVDFECMNDKLVSNEKLPFKVSKKDWDKTQLEKVRLTPENNVCKAFKFGINSDDYLHIANVCINVEEVSQNTNAAKHI